MYRWPSLQRNRNEIRGSIFTSTLPNCPEMLLLDTELENLIFFGQWTNLHDRLQNGQQLVTNEISRLISHIHHTCENKQYCHVGNTAKQCRLGLFQDSDFAGDHEDSKSTSGGALCVFGSHTFVATSLDVLKNKLQFRAFQQDQKSFFWMQDWGWMVSPHLIHGIWSSQFLEAHGIRVIKNGETRLWTNVKFVQHLTQFHNENNLMGWSTIWTMLILFPQTSILLIKKLCFMCLKTK